MPRAPAAQIPDTDDFAKVRRWYKAVAAHPAYAATVVSEDRLIANYSGYADNSATSTVSKQFR